MNTSELPPVLLSWNRVSTNRHNFAHARRNQQTLTRQLLLRSPSYPIRHVTRQSSHSSTSQPNRHNADAVGTSIASFFSSLFFVKLFVVIIWLSIPMFCCILSHLLRRSSCFLILARIRSFPVSLGSHEEKKREREREWVRKKNR